jgi:hypothetical protein
LGCWGTRAEGGRGRSRRDNFRLPWNGCGTGAAGAAPVGCYQWWVVAQELLLIMLELVWPKTEEIATRPGPISRSQMLRWLNDDRQETRCAPCGYSRCRCVWTDSLNPRDSGFESLAAHPYCPGHPSVVMGCPRSFSGYGIQGGGGAVPEWDALNVDLEDAEPPTFTSRRELDPTHVRGAGAGSRRRHAAILAPGCRDQLISNSLPSGSFIPTA